MTEIVLRFDNQVPKDEYLLVSCIEDIMNFIAKDVQTNNNSNNELKTKGYIVDYQKNENKLILNLKPEDELISKVIDVFCTSVCITDQPRTYSMSICSDWNYQMRNHGADKHLHIIVDGKDYIFGFGDRNWKI